jgi:uncharacterized cupin superfamily protein
VIEHRVDFSQLVWPTPMPGVQYRTFDQPGQRLRLVEHSKEMEPHWCARGHVGMILSGAFEIRFDGGVRIYDEGDGLHVPSGEEHRHEAKTLTDTVRAPFVEEG